MDKAHLRTVASEALTTHKQVADWQIEQARVVEKQVGHAFEAGRAMMNLQRDLAQNLGRAWVDAIAPERAEEA